MSGLNSNATIGSRPSVRITGRRWWLLLAAIAGVEAGCLYGTYWLTTLDPQSA